METRAPSPQLHPNETGENPRRLSPSFPGDIRHADVRICRTRAGADRFVTLRYDKRGPAQPQPLPEPGDDRGVRHRGPIVAYSLLRSAGQSAVTALVLSGAFPALGVIVSLI